MLIQITCYQYMRIMNFFLSDKGKQILTVRDDQNCY